jgi:sulfate permease, SulP family
MSRMTLLDLWRREFSRYSAAKFRQDLLAGLTVGAVALPLALAFGVASGATAAAGLVTAILAGLIIGALSGAPYQLSGPTGAMSAILILISARYGLEGVWLTGLMAGVMILAVGILRLGRFIAFIPAPVISGFTSGIAVIIFVSQLDNFFGVHLPETETAAEKLWVYVQGGWMPDWQAVALGALVILLMIFWPARWARLVPGSLVGIVAATLLATWGGWPVATIGDIPRTILLDARLHWQAIPWDSLTNLLAPAISIAALGAVESLLCGAVGSKMTGVRLHANQELIAQGIGNIILPFFGGVPATAAIARTSVAIKSGGQTRMVSIIHALALLAAALLFAPAIAQVPLTALAGVLMVTAYRMNEWLAIRFLFGKRFKTGMITFTITLLATVTLDLTQAILIGAILSAAVFINQVANLQIDIHNVDAARMQSRGYRVGPASGSVRVAYLTGPLFFAATNTFNESFAHVTDRSENVQVLILSMRAVPLIDVTGLEAVASLHEQMTHQGKRLMLSGVQPGVAYMFRRSGLDAEMGAENFFWSAEQAILAAEAYCQDLNGDRPHRDSVALLNQNLAGRTLGAVSADTP